MKSNLLDTHTLIWFLEGSRRLSEKVRKRIEEDKVVNFVSIASLWEMAIKISLGKLEINTSLQAVFKLIESNNFIILPILPDDILVLAGLPYHHGDPFDRMIIAQAQNNDFTILSKDKNFEHYSVDLLW